MADKKEWHEVIEFGKTIEVAKTVSESDVYLFAGISGDFAPVHVNEEYMKKTQFKHRIAHGALIMAYMSWASTVFAELYPFRSVSYGYDHVRFTKPVYFGDTVTVVYESREKDLDKDTHKSQITVTNQHGDVVAVAEHILKYFRD